MVAHIIERFLVAVIVAAGMAQPSSFYVHYLYLLVR
jgi:hypothetical protein